MGMSTAKKAWLAGGIALFALVAIPLGLWYDAVRKADAAIERQRAEYELRLKALRSIKVRREGTPGNGWPRLSKALEQVKALPESDTEKLPRFMDADPPPPPQAADVEPLLKKLEPVLAELTAALGHAEWDPAYPYEDGAAMLIPEVAPTLKLCKILADSARLRFEEGRLHEATELILLGMALSEAIPTKGCLVNRLVGIVGTRICDEELKRLLDSERLTAQDLGSLAARLESIRPWTSDPVLAWEPEWVISRASVFDVARHGSGLLGRQGRLAGMRHLFSERIAVAEALKFMDGYERDVAAAVREGPKGADRLAELERRVEKSDNAIIGMLMPAASRCHRQFYEGEARQGLARLAVAVRRFELDRGAPPAGLEELCPKYLPAIPTDPFSGSPLKLLVKPGEIVLYSWGADRDDDSGRPVPDSSSGVADGDIVWTLKAK